MKPELTPMDGGLWMCSGSGCIGVSGTRERALKAWERAVNSNSLGVI